MDKLKWNYNYSIGNIKKLKDGFIEKQTEDEILDIAEAWLHGKVSFGYKDLQVVDFDDSDFMNWNNLNIDKNANTVRLYFYGLRGVYYLANAYEHTKEKKYIDALSEYQGNLLLAGINYDKKIKKHTCLIEKVDYKK